MDPDFEYQLSCQAEESRKAGPDAQHVAESLTEASGIYRDPNDGTVYEWDHVRKAWFPKIDTDFIAMYQASYGVPPNSSADAVKSDTCADPSRTLTNAPHPVGTSYDDDDDFEGMARPHPSKLSSRKRKPEPEDTSEFVTVKKAAAEEKRRKNQESAAWFDISDEHNRNVYISNLPEDSTEEELLEIMSKCGIVMMDPRTNRPKLKLYKDSEGRVKGDALCTYLKIESIPLALQILDGYRFKKKDIKVERAKFNLKGEYNPEIAKRQKLKREEKKRLQKSESKLLDWRPDKLAGTRPKNEKVVLIKNMFDPKEFEKDPALILEFKKDLQLECTNFGEVKKVNIYDHHPDGIATVGFAEFEQADACLARMNGRWFAGRQLSAELWDGKNKYKVEETEEEKQKRLGQWERFLDGTHAES
ncbi:HIV Tat-specific factor 1-like [Paramacrobiotus metropolitanus]|uniref:HIV Tat-specific factor 1-like n=1 Tax=Paramacrobiotus metropolitanus TaxID=2943436 RepID=UPI00244584F2|nr:HIV Tat-specific factor 1-like [Paramacrobiotus metropolitanus]